MKSVLYFIFHHRNLGLSIYEVDETLSVISGLSDRFTILLFTFFVVIFVFGGYIKVAYRINSMCLFRASVSLFQS